MYRCFVHQTTYVYLVVLLGGSPKMLVYLINLHLKFLLLSYEGHYIILVIRFHLMILLKEEVDYNYQLNCHCCQNYFYDLFIVNYILFLVQHYYFFKFHRNSYNLSMYLRIFQMCFTLFSFSFYILDVHYKYPIDYHD